MSCWLHQFNSFLLIAPLVFQSVPPQPSHYAYDTINRLTAITNNSGSPVGNITYPLYDNLGNRKEEINEIVPNNDFHYTYTYNERYELTQVQGLSPQGTVPQFIKIYLDSGVCSIV